MNKKRIKKQGKKAFTLVELIAVIVILAVILVIVVPMIGDTLTSSEEKVFKLNAEQAVKLAKMHHQQNFNGKLNSAPVTYVVANNKITQNNVDIDLSASISDMDGEITVNSTGDTKVKLYNDEFCVTKSFTGSLFISELVNGECYTMEEMFLAKVGTGGLFEDDHGDLRYHGSNPDNYVTFNNETAGWRIVGLFNVDGEQRIKLVRKDSIGLFSWDSSEGVNMGYGITQWGPSTRTTGEEYEGADLMRELNGDYLNSTLSENVNWYSSNSNQKNAVFDKSLVLKSSAQELIGPATWYTGGITYVRDTIVTLAEAYAAERGTKVKTCTSGDDCNDNVIRTYTWTGKVGLIYPSDFGYASSNSECKDKVNRTVCGNDNWMAGYGWTITPEHRQTVANYTCYVSNSKTSTHPATPKLLATVETRPSVYLISGLNVRGSGTESDPYVFTK